MGHPILPPSAMRPPPNSLAEAILSATRLPASVARRAQSDLVRLEAIESAYSSARATKMGLAMVAGGFAFAIFPFTPGLVLNEVLRESRPFRGGRKGGRAARPVTRN